MENNRNRRRGVSGNRNPRRNLKKGVAAYRIAATTSGSRIVDGFASSKSFVVAVSKIYSQETKDIDRFLKFAESYEVKK